MSHQQHRQSDYPVAPLLLDRWSPRSFATEAIDDETLFSLFEAARWAPSGGNNQPWRFIYAKRDSAQWQTFVDLLNERNRAWASKAAALVILISQTSVIREGQSVPSPLNNHSLDAGAAWLSIALQAQHSGWIAHAIGGFNKEAARQQLEIPEGYHLEIAIAVGKQGSLDTLAPEFHPREVPSSRLPLERLVAEGRFSFA